MQEEYGESGVTLGSDDLLEHEGYASVICDDSLACSLTASPAIVWKADGAWLSIIFLSMYSASTIAVSKCSCCSLEIHKP